VVDRLNFLGISCIGLRYVLDPEGNLNYKRLGKAIDKLIKTHPKAIFVTPMLTSYIKGNFDIYSGYNIVGHRRTQTFIGDVFRRALDLQQIYLTPVEDRFKWLIDGFNFDATIVTEETYFSRVGTPWNLSSNRVNPYEMFKVSCSGWVDRIHYQVHKRCTQ
jgi:hypothetical protein